MYSVWFASADNPEYWKVDGTATEITANEITSIIETATIISIIETANAGTFSFIIRDVLLLAIFFVAQL